MLGLPRRLRGSIVVVGCARLHTVCAQGIVMLCMLSQARVLGKRARKLNGSAFRTCAGSEGREEGVELSCGHYKDLSQSHSELSGWVGLQHFPDWGLYTLELNSYYMWEEPERICDLGRGGSLRPGDRPGGSQPSTARSWHPADHSGHRVCCRPVAGCTLESEYR